MSFDKLIAKVTQAENAMEANERRVCADVRQLRDSWKAMWTPGRIVLAGLVSGYLAGRAEPIRSAARSGSVVRIVSMLGTVFAGTSARQAATEAEHAADASEQAAETVAPGTTSKSAAQDVASEAAREELAHARLQREAEAARQVNAEAMDP